MTKRSKGNSRWKQAFSRQIGGTAKCDFIDLGLKKRHAVTTMMVFEMLSVG